MRQFAMMVAAAAAAATWSNALAQDSPKNPTTTHAKAAYTTGQASRAPVGHRQPRAKDVPPGLENNLQPSLDDRKLDEMLNICRGC